MQGGKAVKLSQPQQFLAQDRQIIDTAYPGDIVGLFDPGIFGIGDTLLYAFSQIQICRFPCIPTRKICSCFC